MKQYYVYIICNHNNKVLYIGVTSDLDRRIFEHTKHLNKGSFTDRYNCEKLVYFEEFSSITQAIDREKQLKRWKRAWKNRLVETLNPSWNDLLA